MSYWIEIVAPSTEWTKNKPMRFITTLIWKY